MRQRMKSKDQAAGDYIREAFQAQENKTNTKAPHLENTKDANIIRWFPNTYLSGYRTLNREGRFFLKMRGRVNFLRIDTIVRQSQL